MNSNNQHAPLNEGKCKLTWHTDFKLLDNVDINRTVILFESGAMCMYMDEWPREQSIAFFELPPKD